VTPFFNFSLFYDPVMTAELRRRQGEYLACSREITAEMVAQWPITRRLWDNTIGMLGPVM
jgi:cardiolipin synthase